MRPPEHDTKPMYWTCNADGEQVGRETTAADAVAAYLDEMDPADWPTEVTAYGFAPMRLPDNRDDFAAWMLEDALERLVEGCFKTCRSFVPRV